MLLVAELDSVLKLLPCRWPNDDEYRFDMGGATIGTAGVVDDELSWPVDDGDRGDPEPDSGRGGYAEAAEPEDDRLMAIGWRPIDEGRWLSRDRDDSPAERGWRREDDGDGL